MSRLRSTRQEQIDAASVGTLVCDTAYVRRLNYAFAPIAQIGMLFACAHGWSVTPATGALFVCCLGDGRACLGSLANRQITQNEEFLQLFPADFGRDLRV